MRHVARELSRCLRCLPLAAILAGCCLGTVENSASGTSDGAGSSGGSTSGAGSTGTSGGSSGTTSGGTTGDPCAGVYCAANYACDPADGVCKCGGQLCDTGNCDPGTGACLEGCSSDGGSLAVHYVGAGAANAEQLPIAHLNETYVTYMQVVCGTPPYAWYWVNQQQIGLLNFYPNQGELEGVATEPSDGGPFLLQMQVHDLAGNTAYGNFLLTVD